MRVLSSQHLNSVPTSGIAPVRLDRAGNARTTARPIHSSIPWVWLLLFAMLTWVLHSNGFAAVPVNDPFDGRFATGGFLVVSNGNNTDGTAEANEPAHRGTPAARSLWWRWTPPENGYAVAVSSNSASLSRIAVYDFNKRLNLLHSEPLLNESDLPGGPDRYEFVAIQGLDYNIAVDGISGASGQVQLEIKLFTKPEMFRQPTDAVVVAGQRASIRGIPLGKLPLTNRWEFSASGPNSGYSNVPGGSTRTLELGSLGVVARKDQGWYRLVSRNEFGAVTSAVAFVEVNECALTGVPSPLFVNTNVGKTVTLKGSALGTPPLSFQWQFQANDRVPFKNIPGATEADLVITNISTDQAGLYRFLASNIACSNQASTNVSVIVNTNNALIIDSKFPASATVITNLSARFEVKVIEGYQPIGIQWWHRSTNGVTNRLLGETAPELFIPAVRFGDAGQYWATVTNRYAALESASATLGADIRPPNDNFERRIALFPHWTNLPLDKVSKTNVVGQNRNATVETGEPSHQGRVPALSVWWSFTPPTDGHVILDLTAPVFPQVLAAYTGPSVDQLVPVLNRTNSVNRFDFVASNRVEYYFAVENQNGAPNSNIGLDLTFDPDLGAPTILKEPGDFEFEFFMLGGLGLGEGCRTFDRLRVEATSLDGVLKYQWQFSTNINADGNWTDIKGQTNAALVLNNVTKANEGWYRVRVNNAGPTAAFTIPVHLTIGLFPLISDNGQPKDVTSNACTSAKFEVIAESCGPMNYQWRQDGVNVTALNTTGARTPILEITNLTPANAGKYDVVIRNSLGSITSTKATLIVISTPTITTQPASITKHGCEVAQFTVAATADCSLDYQWFFRNIPLTGATAPILEIPEVQPENDGTYYAVVSTPFASSTSSVVRLTVKTDPVIVKAPVTQSARSCDVVNLAIEAQGEPECSFLAYQWQRSTTNILAATNRTYSFEAQAETAGDYQVVVRNRWGSLTSAVARVTVDASPQITLQPAAYQRVREGDSFSNVVTVPTCGALTYRWQVRSATSDTFTDVPLDSRRFLSNGWLVVTRSLTNDSGFYRVIVTNIYASVTSAVAAVRVVRSPPNDNFSKSIGLGRVAEISALGYNEYATTEPGEPAHALQAPAHSVWWSWTNRAPSLVTISTVGSDIDTVLGIYQGNSVSNLTTVAQDDDGAPSGRSVAHFMAASNRVFHLAIDGKRGAEGTNLALSIKTTEIVSPPVITIQPLNLAATAGDTATFSVQAYGSPDIVPQWFGKGAPLQGTTRIVDLTNYVFSLTLTNVSPNDDGIYYVVLSNPYGTVSSKKVALTFGSIVRGLVTDATKTTVDGIAVGIPGVLISIGDVSTVTDADGNYELVGVKTGELRADFIADKTRVRLNEQVQFWNRSTLTASLLIAKKEGYYDYVDNQFEVGKGQTVAKRFSMSPIFGGLRFVMNWAEKPGDLDLVLKLPPSAPISYPFIDYLPQNRGTTGVFHYAFRDADVTTGWGPETISIHQFYPGTYSLYARKYPGEGGKRLSESSAQIVAYLGDHLVSGLSTNLQAYARIEVPRVGTNDWWHVCDIDGATTNITWINKFLSAPPGGLAVESLASLLANRPPPPEAALPTLSVVSHASGPLPPPPIQNIAYSWNVDVGTGTASVNEIEPSHAYSEPGWKTVSLKVTELLGTPPKSSTLIRTNYIYVENVPPVVQIMTPYNNERFRAGDPITLTSVADGIDDGISQVDYYLLEGDQRTLLGSSTQAPYSIVFPNSLFEDKTYVFVALAIDEHGESTWSEPVQALSFDLRGDILILRNFDSLEIDAMSRLLGQLEMIRDFDPIGASILRPPVVKVLDQDGLHYGLVQDFKLIVWNDQGATEGGLTDNDVAILKRAYDSGIPLYLMGEQLGASRDLLNDSARAADWDDLLSVRARRQGQSFMRLEGPLDLEGIKCTDRDGLFYGWWDEAAASTYLPYPNSVEVLDPINTVMDVVVQATNALTAEISPLMLRYPTCQEPDFGFPRRLVQGFRVYPTGEGRRDDYTEYDRKVLLINGVAWLLRLYDCELINVSLECFPPALLSDAQQDPKAPKASGRIGDPTPMEFVTRITQNGECVATGVILTNRLAPGFEVTEALLSEGLSPSQYRIETNLNVVTVRFAEIPPQTSVDLIVKAIPHRGEWFTNFLSVVRGLDTWTPCTQSGYIAGPLSGGSLRLAISPTSTNAAWKITVRGGQGYRLSLQSSQDLKSWTTLPQLINTDRDPYEIDLDLGPLNHQFFQLRSHE